jgi:hypothetical protein
MRYLLIAGAAALLSGCGQSANDNSVNQAAANAAQPKKKAAYCFFKDSETKSWTAARGKDGNIVVKGKAYHEDGRYKALLGPAEVTETTAALAPTIAVNDTGYSARDNWWDVSATIPNSAAIDTVRVTCGDKNVAELKVPAKG